MSKKRQNKQTLLSFNTSGGGGQWADEEKEPQPTSQPIAEPEQRAEDSKPRRFDDEEGGQYGRRPYGNYPPRYGGRGGRSYRDRDREIRDQDEERPHNRYTTAYGGGGYYRDSDDRPPRRFHSDRGGYGGSELRFNRRSEEDLVPQAGPFIVIVSNLSPDTDEIAVGEFFEGKGCNIADVDMNADHTVTLTLENRESTITALKQSKSELKGYTITVAVKSEQQQTYVPPSGAKSFDQDRDRDGGDREGGGDRRYYGGRHDRDEYRPRGGFHRGGGYRRGGGGGRGGFGRFDGERRDGYGDRGYGRGRYQDRPPRDEAAPAEPRAPGERPQFTVQVEKHEKKENPYGDATPKDIKM